MIFPRLLPLYGKVGTGATGTQRQLLMQSSKSTSCLVGLFTLVRATLWCAFDCFYY